MSNGIQRLASVRADAGHIQQALRALLTEGQVTEMRALDVAQPGSTFRRTLVGYFDTAHLADAAQAVATLNAKGIYFTPNPLKPELVARACNRLIVAGKGEASRDSDVLRRRWLLVDVDPVRPAGISASDAEHALAQQRAEGVRAVLEARGWPEPVIADSGNGAHLLWRVDLPNDDASTHLLKAVLAALHARFSGEGVQIDQTVFNAARIWKLYGTVARKGDHIPERPHRLARLLSVGGRDVVPLALVQALADEGTRMEDRGWRIEEGRTEGGRQAAESSSLGSPRPAAHEGVSTVNRQLSTVLATLDVREPEAYEGGRRWLLNVCPFDPAHTDGVALFESAEGRPGFKCHHNACVGKGWRELVRLLEKDEGGRMRDEGSRSSRILHPASFPAWSANELLNTEFPPPVWVVPQMLPAGLTILAGRPKSGKSWFALQLAGAVGSGGRVLGQPVEPGRVLYLALEDSPTRLQGRMRLQQWSDAAQVTFKTEFAKLDAGGAALLRQEVTENDYSLVIIDTLSRSLSGRMDQNTTGPVGDLLGDLQRLALNRNLSILVIDHHRKNSPYADDDILTLINGTVAKGATADVVMGLFRENEHSARLGLMGRDLAQGTRKLRLHWDRAASCWQLSSELDPDPVPPQPTMRKQVLDALKELGGTATTTELAEYTSRERSNINKELQSLVEQRRVGREEKKGKEVPYKIIE